MATIEMNFRSVERQHTALPKYGFAQRLRENLKGNLIVLGLKADHLRHKWFAHFKDVVKHEVYPEKEEADEIRQRIQERPPLKELRYTKFPVLQEMVPDADGKLPSRNYIPADAKMRKEITIACAALEQTALGMRKQPYSTAVTLDMISEFHGKYMPYLKRGQMAKVVEVALWAVPVKKDRDLLQRRLLDPNSLSEEESRKALEIANRAPSFARIGVKSATQIAPRRSFRLAETFFDGYRLPDGTVLGERKTVEELIMKPKGKKARLYQLSDKNILDSIQGLIETNQMSKVNYQLGGIGKETAKFVKKHAKFFNNLNNLSRTIAEHALESLLVKRKRSIAHSPEALKANKVKRLIKQGHLTAQHLTKDGAIDPNELAYDRFFIEQPKLSESLSNFVVPKRQRNLMKEQRESLIAYPPVAVKADLVNKLVDQDNLGAQHLFWFGTINPLSLGADDFYTSRPDMARQIALYELPREQWEIILSKRSWQDMDLRKIQEETAKRPVNFSPDVSVPAVTETQGTALLNLTERAKHLKDLQKQARSIAIGKNPKFYAELSKFTIDMNRARDRLLWERQYPGFSWEGIQKSSRRSNIVDMLILHQLAYNEWESENGTVEFEIESINPDDPDKRRVLEYATRNSKQLVWDHNELPGHLKVNFSLQV